MKIVDEIRELIFFSKVTALERSMCLRVERLYIFLKQIILLMVHFLSLVLHPPVHVGILGILVCIAELSC